MRRACRACWSSRRPSPLGVAAERAAFDPADVRLWLPDLLVGWVLVGCGLVGVRTPAGQPLRRLAGGDRVRLVPRQLQRAVERPWLRTSCLPAPRFPRPPARDLPRRVRLLAHDAGRGRLRATSRRCCPRVWDDAAATIVALGRCWSATARSSTGGRSVPRGGPRARRCGPRPALALVLSAGAAGPGHAPARRPSSRPSLLAYQAVLCAIAVGLLAGLVTSDRERVDVTDLVVELRHRTLRHAAWQPCRRPSATRRSTSATGSPTPAPSSARTGEPLALPRAGSRPVGHLRGARRRAGRRTGARSLRSWRTPRVREAVAVGDPVGGREQPPPRPRCAPGWSSSRPPAGACWRPATRSARDWRRRLHDGAERRLLRSRRCSTRSRPRRPSPDTAERVARRGPGRAGARQELRRLARGIHPRVLAEDGSARPPCSPWSKALPVAGRPRGRGGPAAAAGRGGGVLRVCRGAGQRRQVRGGVARPGLGGRRTTTCVTVVVEDDGVGGADPARGSGLRGLADRVATAGRNAPGRQHAGRGHAPRRRDPSRRRGLDAQPILIQGFPVIRKASAGSIGSAGSRVRLPSSSRVNLNVVGRSVELVPVHEEHDLLPPSTYRTSRPSRSSCPLSSQNVWVIGYSGSSPSPASIASCLVSV